MLHVSAAEDQSGAANSLTVRRMRKCARLLPRSFASLVFFVCRGLHAQRSESICVLTRAARVDGAQVTSVNGFHMDEKDLLMYKHAIDTSMCVSYRYRR